MDVFFVQNSGPQGHMNLKFQISDATCKTLAFTLGFQILHFKFILCICCRYPPPYGTPELQTMDTELQIMHLKFQIMCLNFQIMHLEFRLCV
jgi:hypothetical protein